MQAIMTTGIPYGVLMMAKIRIRCITISHLRPVLHGVLIHKEENKCIQECFKFHENPIEDFIDESRYWDGFVGNVADYIEASCDKKSDIENLKARLSNVAEFDGNKFTITDKVEFFKSSYEAWKNNLSAISNISLEEFAGEGSDVDIEYLNYRYESCYEDKFGFYMDDNDEYYGNQTLSAFMRNTKNGDVWYIGEVFDYHS